MSTKIKNKVVTPIVHSNDQLSEKLPVNFILHSTLSHLWARAAKNSTKMQSSRKNIDSLICN